MHISVDIETKSNCLTIFCRMKLQLLWLKQVSGLFGNRQGCFVKWYSLMGGGEHFSKAVKNKKTKNLCRISNRKLKRKS